MEMNVVLLNKSPLDQAWIKDQTNRVNVIEQTKEEIKRQIERSFFLLSLSSVV